MTNHSTIVPMVALWGALVLACGTDVRPTEEGELPDMSQDSQDTDSNSDGQHTDQNVCDVGARDVEGVRMLRRLTSREFEATIRDVFGLDTAAWPGATLPPDAAGFNGFTNNAERLTVNDTYAKALLVVANSIGSVVASDEHLVSILPCAEQGDRTCAEEYLSRKGRRLYRRRLTTAEATRYLELYDVIAKESNFANWVKFSTIALIQSPYTLYRSEIGIASDDEEGLYELSSYEVATELAYMLTGHPPSESLLDAAEAGQLDHPAGIEIATAELIASKAPLQAQVKRFARQWLTITPLPNLQKDPAVYPGFTSEVRDAMLAEAETFVWEIFNTEDASASDLFSWNHSYVNGVLSDYYGFGAADGEVFERTERPSGWGRGLTGLGSLLAVTSNNRATSPTLRGKLVRAKFLCTPPSPPPDAVVVPEPTETETTRERYEVHVSDPICAACHLYMDPIGFGLEHLDAAGRYRETEGVFSIDATGEFVATSQGNIEFEGADELSRTLADLPEASYCVASYLASFAFGVDDEYATCMINTPADAMATGNRSIAEFYRDLTQTPHFTRRRN